MFLGSLQCHPNWRVLVPPGSQCPPPQSLEGSRTCFRFDQVPSVHLPHVWALDHVHGFTRLPMSSYHWRVLDYFLHFRGPPMSLSLSHVQVLDRILYSTGLSNVTLSYQWVLDQDPNSTQAVTITVCHWCILFQFSPTRGHSPVHLSREFSR